LVCEEDDLEEVVPSFEQPNPITWDLRKAEWIEAYGKMN